MAVDGCAGDWACLPLRKLVLKFLNGGTPSTAKPEYWNGTIPWITGADAEEMITLTARKHVTEKGLRESATNVVPKGCVLLVTRTGVGKVSIAGVDVAISQDLTGLVPDSQVVDASYLYRQLSSIGPVLQRLAQGTVIQGIEREQIESLPIPVPPLAEQRRIAAVLDTVDEAIAKTEAVIGKLRQVRAGLLHDLLTRGLDENGELRDPVAQPEEFKETEVGRIPREWQIAPFWHYAPQDRPCIRTGPFGSSLKQQHWVEEGVPVITIGSLGEGELLASELLFVTDKTAASLASYAVRTGDILFSRVADVGRSVVVGQDQDGWIMSSNLMCISLDTGRAVPDFVHTNIASNVLVREEIRRLVSSAGRDVATAPILSSILLSWPAKREQLRIVEADSAVRSSIGAEQEHLSKLRVLKSGLMSDLLTGRVRVPEGVGAAEVRL